VIEHPRLAGGHLGAAKVADLNAPRFDFERVNYEALALFRAAGLEKDIPLIAAGGIRSHADILRGQAFAHAKFRCTNAFDCLAQCGLRDGLADWGPFCIDHQLAAALRGDVKKGLFFRGTRALPFGAQVRSVRELLERLLSDPCDTPQAAAC
jgi:NAD(P)H-dependent flavin oxidoreductase YrpB (nitropropane dioxygenase family)